MNSKYIPHAVDSSIFKPLPEKDCLEIRKKSLTPSDIDKTIFFWNNRNARRKQSGTLLWWFKEWADKHNLSDKVQLIMHTDPKDSHGQDLEHIMAHLNCMKSREVLLSTAKVNAQDLAAMYSMVDCTINISDAEGFGLATLESLSCGTPIIVNMTGGLQEQVMDGKDTFGIPIFPSAKSVIGSQDVPYIYEDRISKSDFFSALNKMMALGKEGRKALGQKGREHVMKNYNFDKFGQTWVDFMTKIHETEGSWDTRKGYNGIRFKEVA